MTIWEPERPSFCTTTLANLGLPAALQRLSCGTTGGDKTSPCHEWTETDSLQGKDIVQAAHGRHVYLDRLLTIFPYLLPRQQVTQRKQSASWRKTQCS